ncbi:hypothetical protein [Bradyrhizobium sp. USDA 4486]
MTILRRVKPIAIFGAHVERSRCTAINVLSGSRRSALAEIKERTVAPHPRPKDEPNNWRHRRPFSKATVSIPSLFELLSRIPEANFVILHELITERPSRGDRSKYASVIEQLEDVHRDFFKNL